jgi:hypothetical protein
MNSNRACWLKTDDGREYLRLKQMSELNEKQLTVKANFEEINELLQGATFRCVDEDLDILLDTPDGRTIVISTYFECLAVHSAGKSINITPNNFVVYDDIPFNDCEF